MGRFNKEEFGNKIKEARKTKGLSTDNLAMMINKSQSMIVRYEKGDVLPDAETISLICDKLEITENEDFIYDDIVNLKLNVLRDTLFLYEVDDPLEYINYEIYYYNDKFYVNAKREDINLIENSNLVYGDIVYKIIGRGIKI